MKKEMQQEKLIDLLSIKEFSELSNAERQSISCFESEDYMQLSELQKSTRVALKFDKGNTIPDHAILTSLFQHLDKHQSKKKPSLVNVFFEFKLPIYQAAAMVVFAILAMAFFRPVFWETKGMEYYKPLVDTMGLCIPENSALSLNDSGFQTGKARLSSSVCLEKFVNPEQLSMDRFIPEIEEMRMMDIAYRLRQ